MGCSSSQANQCEAAQRTAQELLDTHADCRAGVGCVLVIQPDLGIPCSLLFHCPFAVAQGTDVSAFAARAKEIQAQAQVCRQCGIPCPMPTCVPSDSVRATCNTTTGRCNIAPN
jgi:hypothetical protein